MHRTATSQISEVYTLFFNGLKSYLTAPHNILAFYTFALAMLLALYFVGSVLDFLPDSFDQYIAELPGLFSFLSITVIMLHLFLPKGANAEALREAALFVGIPAGYISAVILIPANGWMQIISLLIAIPLLAYVISTVNGILSMLKNIAFAVFGGLVAAVLIILLAPQWEGTIWMTGSMVITTVFCFVASASLFHLIRNRDNKQESTSEVDKESSAVEEAQSENVDCPESEPAGSSSQSGPEQPPEQYLPHIMGQYRLWVGMYDKDSQRLLTTHWYFLATYLILTSLVVIALTSGIVDFGASLFIGIPILGAILSYMWFTLAQSCIKRKQARLHTILELEQHLPRMAHEPEPTASGELWFPWILFAFWLLLAAAVLIPDVPSVVEIAVTQLP